MTPATRARRRSTPAVRRTRYVSLLVMAAFWTLLWGDISWANAVGGLAVALVVTASFPLPDVALLGRIRPWGVLRFLAYFVRDLIFSSVQVTWAAIRPGRRVRNAVIAVTLRVQTDLNLTFTGEALTLIPGSLIIDARRDTGTLYIHVLDVKNRHEVERFRRSVLALEARIVRAFGTDDDLRKIDVAEGKVISS